MLDSKILENSPVTTKQIKLFLDKIKTIFITSDGGVITGALNVNGKMTVRQAPVDGTDAVNKSYVDELVGAVNDSLDDIIGE